MLAAGGYRSAARAVAAAALAMPLSVFEMTTGYPSTVPLQNVHPCRLSTLTLASAPASRLTSTSIAPWTTIGGADWAVRTGPSARLAHALASTPIRSAATGAD